MLTNFIPPSYLKGIARLADLWGNLDHYELGRQTDQTVLKKDWELVGQDLWQAVKQYDRERTQERKTNR